MCRYVEMDGKYNINVTMAMLLILMDALINARYKIIIHVIVLDHKNLYVNYKLKYYLIVLILKKILFRILYIFKLISLLIPLSIRIMILPNIYILGVDS